MDYYFLDTYGDRNKYISVNDYFFWDQEERAYKNGADQFIYEQQGINHETLLADLYSDREDKANWNRMFAAAQLAEHPEEEKAWGDILGCTGELVANERFKETFLRFCDKKSTECIPVKLRNEALEMPDNYFLINPLLEFEALNYQASQFTFFFDEIQSRTKKVILDPQKLQEAPHVFRIKYKTYNIVISEAVVEELIKHDFSNLEIQRIDQLAKHDTIDDERYKLNTALLSASEHDKFAMVKSLIERGGDIYHRNADGISTLEILEEKKQTNLINLFHSLKKA